MVKAKKFKINTNVINIALICIIFIAVLIYMFTVDDINNIITVLKSVKISWMIVGILCMLMYWILESLCLYVVTKKSYKSQKFIDSFRVSMLGQLFNSITPFSSGGQPMQAVAMVSEGKSASTSLSILLIKFIVYQATLVLYTLIVIILKYTYFRSILSNFINLAVIGFVINLLIIVFLVLIGINQNIVRKVVEWIYRLLRKIKIVKNLDEKLENVNNSISNFHEQFKIIKKEKFMIFRLTIYTTIQLTMNFLVTYAVYRAFGQSGASVSNIICAQAFLLMIMSFIPIPGAGIAAEGGFLVIFSTFFEKNTINMAVLFWRLYTFYLPIIVGAIFLFIRRKKEKKEDNSKEVLV